MKVGFYGELDPYTGGVPQRRESLPDLVSELGLLLLMNDVVVIPPDDLLSHGLALPAFEALSDFVRAGRLTTLGASTFVGPEPTVTSRACARPLRTTRARPRALHGFASPPDR